MIRKPLNASVTALTGFVRAYAPAVLSISGFLFYLVALIIFRELGVHAKRRSLIVLQQVLVLSGPVWAGLVVVWAIRQRGLCTRRGVCVRLVAVAGIIPLLFTWWVFRCEYTWLKEDRDRVIATVLYRHTAHGGQHDSITCYWCGEPAVSVWFTRRTVGGESYGMWFVCGNCGKKLRSVAYFVPAEILEGRISTDLEKEEEARGLGGPRVPE